MGTENNGSVSPAEPPHVVRAAETPVPCWCCAGTGWLPEKRGRGKMQHRSPWADYVVAPPLKAQPDVGAAGLPQTETSRRQAVIDWWEANNRPTLAMVAVQFGFSRERARQILHARPGYRMAALAHQDPLTNSDELARRIAWLKDNPAATSGEFAEAFGLAASTASSWLLSRGMRQPLKRRAPKPNSRVAKIVAMAVSGMSRNEIARKLRVDHIIVTHAIQYWRGRIPELANVPDCRRKNRRRRSCGDSVLRELRGEAAP